MPIKPRDPNNTRTDKTLAARTETEPRQRTRLTLDDTSGTQEPTPPKAESKQGPNLNEDGTYRVGKNKPPLHSRWQKGQSGNPRGPKKNKPNMETLAVEVMEQKITLTSPQGAKTKMSQAAALMRKLYEKAVKGDLKTAQYLFELYTRALDRRSHSAGSDDGLSPAEQQMLASLLGGFCSDAPGGEPA